MLASAHLAGDVDVGLVGVKGRAELVVFDAEYVRSGFGDELKHLCETAGAVKERNGSTAE